MKKNRYYLLLMAIILLQSNALSTIRYVKAGNATPTPPYISWLTASDSIQKCINVCVPGDTIYVGNGVYREKLTLIHKLALIGSGWDSCVVDISRFPEPPVGHYVILMIAKDSCKIQNFKFIGGYYLTSTPWVGIGRDYWPIPNITKLDVYDNYFYKITSPISANSFTFKRNIVNLARSGVLAVGLPVSGIAEIDSNYFLMLLGEGISGSGSIPIARNNIFHFRQRGKVISVFESNFNAVASNNIAFVDGPGSDYVFEPDGKYYNNVSFVEINSVFNFSRSTSVAKNNIIINARGGVTLSGNASPDSIRYNNFWKVGKKYINFTIPNDSTNLSVEPMFVREHALWDTLPGDYHLQKYSPLIDKGDPSILDRDGSRSDMGIFGGPLGEIYEYRDYAPKPPQGIKLRYDPEGKTVFVRWEKATEADFNDFVVYMDTISGFIPDSSRIILRTRDTSFVESVRGHDRVFYKLRAVDSQGNKSEPGIEVGIVINGTGTESVISEEYKLYPNDPNPFRERTKIGYYVGKRSYVKIMVYNINGELVSYAENRERERGYYEVEFEEKGESTGEYGIATSLVSGIYLYKMLATDSESGLPAFSGMRKMVKVK